MINIFYLILATLLILLVLTNITKHMNSNYSIVVCFLIILLFIGLGGQIYAINELLNYFNINYSTESLFIVGFFVPTSILEAIYFKYILLKTSIPKKGSKLVMYLEKFKLWNNKIFQNVIAILMIIGCILAILSLIIIKPINTTTEVVEVKLIGIEYNESYTDNRGTFHDEEYEFKFKFKYMNEDNKTSTINTDNFDKENLKKYYEVLKNNFEGVYSAKIEVTEYTDGSKMFNLKDIILE